MHGKKVSNIMTRTLCLTAPQEAPTHTYIHTHILLYVHAYVERRERDGWMCVRDRERREGGREGGREGRREGRREGW
jgi:hypothetical protein